VAEYRIYMFCDGHLGRAETIEAEDDAGALNYASVFIGSRSFEIWKGDQMIVSFDAPAPDVAGEPT
jgi:hypothetical protein